MNLNLINVKSRLVVLAAGLTVSSLVSLPSVAFSAEAQTNPVATQASIAEGVAPLSGSTEPEAFAAEKTEPSYLLGTVQDEAISNALLVFLYLVLPAGFGFALWHHDKRNQERLARFTLQVVSLERIWQQKSQA